LPHALLWHLETVRRRVAPVVRWGPLAHWAVSCRADRATVGMAVVSIEAVAMVSDVRSLRAPLPVAHRTVGRVSDRLAQPASTSVVRGSANAVWRRARLAAAREGPRWRAPDPTATLVHYRLGVRPVHHRTARAANSHLDGAPCNHRSAPGCWRWS